MVKHLTTVWADYRKKVRYTGEISKLLNCRQVQLYNCYDIEWLNSQIFTMAGYFQRKFAKYFI